jgi:hypothetical protein
MEQEQPQFQYRISKPAKDSKDAVIEKSGISTVEFTLGDLEKKQTEWSREKREFDGQITVEQAKVDNILHHHPWIKRWSEKKLFTAWMFYECMKTVTELTKQRDMRIKALDEYQIEKEHIMKVLGFEKTQV